MKKAFALILCVVAILGLAGCSSSGPSYYGNWSIGDKVADAPLGDYNDSDLAAIQSATLSFSKESASCFGDQISSLGDVVSNPDYITQSLSKDAFESTMGETFAAIGHQGDSITQVTVINSSDSNTGIVFYVVDNNTLLANSLGTFFLLNRKG